MAIARRLAGVGLAELAQAQLQAGRRGGRHQRRVSLRPPPAFASLLIHEGRLSVVDIAAQLGHNPTVCLDSLRARVAEQRGSEPVNAEAEIAAAQELERSSSACG